VLRFPARQILDARTEPALARAVRRYAESPRALDAIAAAGQLLRAWRWPGTVEADIARLDRILDGCAGSVLRDVEGWVESIPADVLDHLEDDAMADVDGLLDAIECLRPALMERDEIVVQSIATGVLLARHDLACVATALLVAGRPALTTTLEDVVDRCAAQHATVLHHLLVEHPAPRTFDPGLVEADTAATTAWWLQLERTE
jgi:hypothetical protein